MMNKASDNAKKIQEQLTLVNKALAACRDKAIVRLQKRFDENGGCSTCHGRGWVVVWDTLDSMSGCYAEYGKCSNPECTEDSRAKSGLAPYISKYDLNRGLRDMVETDEEYKRSIKNLSVWASELNYELSLSETCRVSIRRGDTVLVARGRKNQGVTGEVSWYGDSQWGPRVGLRDAKGNIIAWDYARNCERLVPSEEAVEAA